jgi:hypothetical protein
MRIVNPLFISLVLVALLQCGCATTNLGDLELLNDMGSNGRAVGSLLRTADSSCKVITGHACDNQRLNSAQINRTVGELKQLPDYRSASLPHKIQQVQVILR